MSMYDLVKKIDALMENVEPAAAKTPTRIQEILVILEERMSPAQKEKREEIVKGMKKDVAGLKKRYGDRWEDVMYATATKQAVSEAADATDYRPKSQGGTRKELLAKYKKSGDPKDAAAARRAGATQAELKAAKKTVEEGIKQIVRKFDPTIKSRLRRKADKLDDLGDETGQDLKYMDMEPQDVMTRAMDPETHYRNADRYRRLANKKQGVMEEIDAIEEGIKQIVRKLDPTIKSRLRRKADKLDDLGDETRKDLEYMDMDVRDVMTRAMDPETYYRNADRYRRLANKKKNMEEIDAIEEGIKQIVRKLDPTIKSRLRRKADKLDDLGDETRKDLEYMDMDVRDVMTRAMDPETYYRNADRYRKLANKKQGVMEEIDAIEEGIKQIVRKLDPTIKSRLRRKADKLDDLGDETGQDLKYMDMEPQDVMTRAMDPETHYRNADRYRRLANKKQGVEEGSNAAKPDFLDLDKDGNKKESMKKAQQDLASKKKVDESVSVNISASDADAFGVIMKLAGLPVIGASQDSVAPETTSMGACMEARDDETPYDNKPDEKYSSIRDVTRAGKDLNRPKSQHADKAKLGDNPLATDLTESLWQAYEDLKKKI